MKILLTTDTWAPVINGVVTSTSTLRAALTAQGHEVRVLTLSGDCHTYTKDGVTSLGSLDAGLVYPGARLRAPALNRAIRDLIDWILYTPSASSALLPRHAGLRMLRAHRLSTPITRCTRITPTTFPPAAAWGARWRRCSPA